MSADNKLINASALLGLELEDLPYNVENLVVPGLTILAATPKVGKSYLILYLAYCMAIGQNAFNKLKVKKSKVLYLALEDSHHRLKKRLKQIVTSSLTGRICQPDHLDIMVSLDNETDKIGAIKTLIEENEYEVVLIDILQRITDGGQTGSYKKEYSLIKELKDISDKTNTAIIVVHHTNKKTSANSIDTISGTRGIVGACDNIMLLTRLSNNEDVSKKGTLQLEVLGRDLESNSYCLKYGSKDGFYVLQNSPEEESCRTEKINKAWELSKQNYTQEQICKLLGVTQGYVSKLLKAKKDELLRAGNLDDAADINPDKTEN